MDPPLPGAGVAPGVGAAGAGVPGTGAAGAGFAGAGVIGALVAGAAPLQITCAIVASNASAKGMRITYKRGIKFTLCE